MTYLNAVGLQSSAGDAVIVKRQVLITKMSKSDKYLLAWCILAIIVSVVGQVDSHITYNSYRYEKAVDVCESKGWLISGMKLCAVPKNQESYQRAKANSVKNTTIYYDSDFYQLKDWRWIDDEGRELGTIRIPDDCGKLVKCTFGIFGGGVRVESMTKEYLN